MFKISYTINNANKLLETENECRYDVEENDFFKGDFQG